MPTEKESKKLSEIAASATKKIGSAFVYAGKEAFKFGTEFEDSMAKVSTLVDTSSIDMNLLNDKILALSSSSGVAASELGNTLFNAINSGLNVTDDMSGAMAFLESNIKLAKAGFTDVTTAVDISAKILNAYQMDISETDKIHKVLMQTQNISKATISELGDALSGVTSTAANMGVGFDQVGAAIANMTSKGIPVAQATEQLNELFNELGQSGSFASENLAKATAGTEFAGKSFQDLMQEGIPLNSILETMSGYANDSGFSLSNMFSSIDAGDAALANCGENSKSFTEALSSMNTETDVVGEAFDKISDTTSQQLNGILNELRNTFIQLFLSLQPAIDMILPALAKIISELSPLISDLIAKVMPLITDVLAQLLPPLMEIIKNILPIVIKLIEILIPPLLTIIETLLPPLTMLIDALLPILNHLIDLLQPILDIFIALLTPIISLITMALEPLLAIITPLIESGLKLLGNHLNSLLEIFQNVMAGIFNHVSEKFSKVKDVFSGIIDYIKNVFTDSWSDVWEGIKTIFSNIWEGMKSAFKLPINWIIDGLNGFIQALNKIKLPDWVPLIGGKGINIPLIPRLKRGASFIPNDYFPAYLDYGERVLTQEQNVKFNTLGGLNGMEKALNGQITSNFSQQFIIHNVVQGDIEMDGFKVGTVVMRNIDDVKKYT